jgi:hypothetical protein
MHDNGKNSRKGHQPITYVEHTVDPDKVRRHRASNL